MNSRLAHYIISYYQQLMTPSERCAYSHLGATMKATSGRSDKLAQEEAQHDSYWSRYLSHDSEILQLANDGWESFCQKTAERILAEHKEDVFLNCCPHCGQLARTPTARQCRICGFDWHMTNGVQNAK